MNRKWGIFAALGGLGLFLSRGVLFLVAHQQPGRELDAVPLLKALVGDSRRKLTLEESGRPGTFMEAKFEEGDLPAVVGYINANRDYSAYHALFVLRYKHPEAYQAVPAEAKAAVICSALGNVTFLNDFGFLRLSETYDFEAARALLERKGPANEFLQPLLHDRERAHLFGTKEPSMSDEFKYRRADFAFRYISLILGRNPSFERDPAARDVQIDALMKELKTKRG